MLFLVLLLGLSVPPVADARHPAPSPDGTGIAFVWRGMLFLVDARGGDPRCVTPGGGVASNPEWSPDGLWIAFTSSVTGGGDVYVMPSSGGIATRLTYHSGEDLVQGWKDDRILFTSSREGGTEWVYSVPVTGGTPELLIPAPVVNLACGPDGFIIETGSTPWWVRHYRGSASSSLWIGSGSDWTALSPDSRDQRWPMVVNGTVHFVMEDEDGMDRFWAVSGATAVAVSDPFPGGITFPGLGGGKVAFESAGELLVVSTAEWRPDTIRVNASTDYPFPAVSVELAGIYTDDFAVSPDGSSIALQASGGIYTGVIEDGEIRQGVKRLTGSTCLEESPEFSPDGMMLLYQREDGEGVRLVLAEGTPETGFTTRTLETGTLVARSGRFCPDGSMISFLDQGERLFIHQIRTGATRQVCETRGVIHHSWSPDGRWIAFSAPWEAHREDVFIVASGGGEPVNVSRHPNDDFQPVWTPDGRRLIWASRTDDGYYSIRQAWLRSDDWYTPADSREEILDSASCDVEIDFADFVRRVETLCTVRAWYEFYGLSADGRTVFLPGHDQDDQMDLWSVSWQGDDLVRLTFGGLQPTRIQPVESGDVFLLSYGNTVRAIPPGGGGGTVYGWTCPFTVDIPALQAAKFDHAWRLLRDNFYDEDMHGTHWEAIREVYRPRAVQCVLNTDFNDVVRRMLGELSASHLGIWGPWSYERTAYTGELGVLPGPFPAGGGIAVDSVIPGSPAHLGGDRLYPGDIILSVDGVPVGESHNFYSPLQLTTGRKVTLRVAGSGGIREIELEPTSAWRMWQLEYGELVARNRRMVRDLSGDRVGYLHIPAMNQEAVEDFRRDLYAEGLDREAMIVDIRGNGGGHTHDQILESLGRPAYAWSRGRSGRGTIEPLGVWRGPLVLIIDQTCYSDAEIFAAAWKEMGLGPVVGAATYGAVIGTVDVSLADGTSFRLPGTGWYTLSGMNLENNGVTPDIEVIPFPSDPGLGIDRQLESAVSHALSVIETEGGD
jgi:tricorn protease